MRTINVARDFSKFPAGRYKAKGKGSGQEFRDKFLVPALDAKERVIIELDGAAGYPPSFLEEAFGGLVRLGYKADDILANFEFHASPSFSVYKIAAETYVREAAMH
tara:strand:- start:17021 stop:17338 length:318 start_codon:yes stop_codon:yes gene_type:complete